MSLDPVPGFMELVLYEAEGRQEIMIEKEAVWLALTSAVNECKVRRQRAMGERSVLTVIREGRAGKGHLHRELNAVME